MPKVTEFHLAMKRALSEVAPRVTTLDDTRSTNDDARALALAGAPNGSVVVANEQTAGRGRLGRAWQADVGTSLLMSWIVRPHLRVDRWPLLPLLAGLAAVEAVRERTMVEAVLKWPNDLLVGERKLAGILAEAEPPSFAIIGVGVNVSQVSFEPTLNATSLAIEGAQRLDRADLAAAILTWFAAALEDVDAAMERYRARCATIGRAVRVTRAGRDALEGIAERVDPDGALVVAGERVAAGDVTHVRPLG